MVARLALLEDVLQVQLENGSKELKQVRGVVVLVDDGLAELGACRGPQDPVTVLGSLSPCPTQSPCQPLHTSTPPPPAMSAPLGPTPPAPSPNTGDAHCTVLSPSSGSLVEHRSSGAHRDQTRYPHTHLGARNPSPSSQCTAKPIATLRSIPTQAAYLGPSLIWPAGQDSKENPEPEPNTQHHGAHSQPQFNTIVENKVQHLVQR